MHRPYQAVARLLPFSLLVASCAPLAPFQAGPTASLAPWPTATVTRRPPTPIPTVTAPVALGPTATPFKHVVVQGETFLGIAGLYGLEQDALMLANPGINPGLLSIGQELLIPGPEGTPIGSLIPTSTPIPLSLQPPTCYPQPSGGVRCLAGIHNPTTQDLENLLVEIRLHDASGDILRAEEVFPPLNLLPAGATMPLAVSFPEELPELAAASALVLTVIIARDPETRFHPVEIEQTIDVRQDGGLSWLVGGTIQAAADLPEASRTAVLVTAFDDAGRIAGFAVWEADPALEAGERREFEARVFSLGPEIARVELMAESYGLVPVD